MRYILPILFIFLYSCQTQIKYPDGGFDYPKNVSGRDTDIYYYPLKDSFPRGHEFYAFNQSIFFGVFDEPNLSIKPLEKETFRLTWSTAFGNTLIISINEDFVTIKKGNGEDGYIKDTIALTKTDSLLTGVLMKYYPIDSANPKYIDQKKRLDSLVKLYPQLLDHSYYAKFFEKIPVRNKNYHYQLTKYSITKEQFAALAEKINAAGYWKMPIETVCNIDATDGGGFTLEANTKKKYQLVISGCGRPAFGKLCLKILEFANIDKEELYR